VGRDGEVAGVGLTSTPVNTAERLKVSSLPKLVLMIPIVWKELAMQNLPEPKWTS
jgi:hypothetical protein